MRKSALVARCHHRVSPLCPSTFPSDTVTAAFFLPPSFSFASLLPSLPPPSLFLAPPVTAISAWLCITYCACTEQAASALKPVEISSERKEEQRERERESTPLLSFLCSCIYFRFWTVFPPPLFFYLMNWLLLKEEGLLVSLEGEGGELVPYSSLQECKLWFENGEPCHTLSHLSHSCNYACECCLLTFTCCSTFAPQLCVLSDLTAGAALSVILLNGICKK